MLALFKTSPKAPVAPCQMLLVVRRVSGFHSHRIGAVIQKKYNVSHDDRAWFGHSLGGLFGIYAMLNNDGLFRRFLIGSLRILGR